MSKNIWDQPVLPSFQSLAKRMHWDTFLDVLSTTPDSYEDRTSIASAIDDAHPEKKTILLQGVIQYVLSGDYTLKFRLQFDNGTSLLCNFPKFAKDNHCEFPNGDRVVLQVRPVISRFSDPDQPIFQAVSWICMYPKRINKETTGSIKAIYKGVTGANGNIIGEAVAAHLNALEKAFKDEPNKFFKKIKQVHRPHTIDHAEKVRKEIAKMEVVKIARDIAGKQRMIKTSIMITEDIINKAIKAARFTPTKSQEKTLKKLSFCLSVTKEQRHILSADVGMGKTYVAAILAASVAMVQGGANIPPVAVVAPTSILADQLALEFKKFFPKMNVWRHGQDNQAFESATNTHLVVGTTSVFSIYKNNIYPRLLIVDEEHRFGVEHRDKLVGEDTAFLSMTATPIPRSAGILMCGGSKLHQLTDRPKPRNVRTVLESGNFGRKRTLDGLINHLKNENGKALVIYPAVDSDKMSNIKDAQKKWEKIWPELGVIHSQIKDATSVLNDFKEGKFRLLLASTRVEVGIDISDATMILIIDAERFGLATLHQLRGRVGRGGLPGICTLISDNLKAQERLKFFTQCNNGIELAEYDLAKRGMGSIDGSKQSGHMFRFFSMAKDMNLLMDIAA